MQHHCFPLPKADLLLTPFSHLFSRSYISSVESYLLNLTMNKPWLTPEDFKPVHDRVERLKVSLLLLPSLPLSPTFLSAQITLFLPSP
jgi:hypothetical protein